LKKQGFIELELEKDHLVATKEDAKINNPKKFFFFNLFKAF
jgi:hypothetical protein